MWHAGSGIAKRIDSEIIRHGKTGFIADDAETLLSFVPAISEIDRRTCRQHVEKHFSMERMASDYIQVYEQMIQKKDNRHIVPFQFLPPTLSSPSRGEGKIPLRKKKSPLSLEGEGRVGGN